MSKYIDLHTHTTASDGNLDPSDLVKKARRTGLQAIAITDHDQVGGIKEAEEAGKEYNLEIVTGIEITCYEKNAKEKKEFHILGYFIDYKNKELLNYLEKVQKGRVDRAKNMVDRLSDLGWNIDWIEVRMRAKGSVGRPHIAKTVLEKEANLKKLDNEFGYMPTVSDFIKKYLIPGKPAYFEKFAYNPKQAIELIKKSQGLAVLAHPCYDVPEGEEEIIERFKKWGLIGLEAIYPYKDIKKSKEKIEYFTCLADKYDLLVTGGSDYHGTEGLGAGLGILNWGLEVPYSILEELKKLKNK